MICMYVVSEEIAASLLVTIVTKNEVALDINHILMLRITSIQGSGDGGSLLRECEYVCVPYCW